MAEISFIIPVYGVEKYIHKCLDSVLNQTFKDFEVVIVDDGSPDNCPAICDEYAAKDPRVKVIHKKNGGVSAARNDGLDAASGNWAYFVDSDDWLELDSAEKLYNRAMETGADCVMSDPIVQYSNRSVRGYMFSEEFCTEDRTIIEGVQKFMLCHKYNPYYTTKTTVGVAAPWAKFVRMDVLKNNKVCFDPYVMGRFDDGLWTLYMLDHVKRFAYLAQPTYNYRIIGTSICYSFKPNAMEILEKGFERTEKFINDTGKDESFRKASYGRICRYLALQLSQYFFADANPKSKAEASKELKELLGREPYRTAIREVDLKMLDDKHKVVVMCARMKCIPALRAYAGMKKLKK